MDKHILSYIGIGTLNAMLVALTGLIGAGKVPLPPEYAWLGVVLVAGLTFLTANLPKLEAALLQPAPAPAPAPVIPPAPPTVPPSGKPAPAPLQSVTAGASPAPAPAPAEPPQAQP